MERSIPSVFGRIRQKVEVGFRESHLRQILIAFGAVFNSL